MLISAINNVPKYNNIRKLKQNQTNPMQNNTKNMQADTFERKHNQNPSFGIDPFTIAMFAMYFGVYGSIFYYAMSDDKKREEEAAKIKEQYKKNINETASEYHITKEEAEKLHNTYMKLAAIEPTNDGNEIGLNAVRGYGVEKYKIMTEVISPIIAANNNVWGLNEWGTEEVPNGVLLYGPSGSGKTYMADKICEHVNHFGVKTKDIVLDPNDHEGNAKVIQEAFDEGKKRHEETGKYTVINFKQDFDNFFLNRSKDLSCIQEVKTLLSCAENCKKDGVVWLATANNPKNIDPAIIRAGRVDKKIPIGNMEDFAISDTIKYFMLKHNDAKSVDNFDYNKVLSTMKNNKYVLTPAELEIIVSDAHKHKEYPDAILTADDVINEMICYCDEGMPTLDKYEQRNFRKNSRYLDGMDAAEQKMQDLKNGGNLLRENEPIDLAIMDDIVSSSEDKT